MREDPQLSVTKFHWQLNGKSIFFSLLFFPLLISLGIWQLDRAEEKRTILQQYNANQGADTAAISDLLQDTNVQYRSTIVSGFLDGTRRIFLDNRVKYGRPGYEVFEPLQVNGLVEDGRPLTLLVNRGWVPASLDRRQLPEVESITDVAEFRGVLYRQLPGGYRLDDGIVEIKDWPSRIGWISVERAQTLFDTLFYSYQLRLDSESVGALDTGWPTVAVQPEKHTGYAVQWFIMAAVLLIMTVVANSNIGSMLKRK